MPTAALTDKTEIGGWGTSGIMLSVDKVVVSFVSKTKHTHTHTHQPDTHIHTHTTREGRHLTF